MTPQEEIELIVNTAYLRGCDSNFKTAIAAMQESEKLRLSSSTINVSEDGNIFLEYDLPPDSFYVKAFVYGAPASYFAEITVDSSVKDEERKRLADLVKMIKEQSPN